MTRPADRTQTAAEMVAEIRVAHADRTRRVEANEVRMRETVAERHAPALCDAVARKDALLARCLSALSPSMDDTTTTVADALVVYEALVVALCAELEGK